MINKLKEFRKEHKLAQKDISSALGYNIWSWRDYETGRRNIPQHVLKSIQMYSTINKKVQQCHHGVSLNIPCSKCIDKLAAEIQIKGNK